MNGARELFQAIEAGHTQTIREMLAADAGLARARNERGVSALLDARYRQRFDVVELLLDAARGDVDVFEAAALGLVDPLARLVAQDPRVTESRSPDGFSPLQLASFFAQPAAAKLLLSRGARVEATSKNAMELRALHAAAAGGSAEVVDLLLSHGADANARQHGGFTALHAAANAGRADIARALLAHGADASAATDEGRTAVDIATSKGHAAVLQVLRATRS